LTFPRSGSTIRLHEVVVWDFITAMEGTRP